MIKEILILSIALFGIAYSIPAPGLKDHPETDAIAAEPTGDSESETFDVAESRYGGYGGGGYGHGGGGWGGGGGHGGGWGGHGGHGGYGGHGGHRGHGGWGHHG